MVFKESDVPENEVQAEQIKPQIRIEELDKLAWKIDPIDFKRAKTKKQRQLGRIELGQVAEGSLRRELYLRNRERLMNEYEIVKEPHQDSGPVVIDQITSEQIAEQDADKEAQAQEIEDLALAEQEAKKLTAYLGKSETIEVSQESQDRETRVKEIEIFFDELDKIDNLENDFLSLQPELQEEFLSLMLKLLGYQNTEDWVERLRNIKVHLLALAKDRLSRPTGKDDLEILKNYIRGGGGYSVKEYLDQITAVRKKLEELKKKKIKKTPPKVPDKYISGLASAVKSQSRSANNPNAGKPRPPLPPSMRKK
jgi:hypothetical protein